MEPRGPIRVLVVDDGRNIADTLVMILAMRGYNARAVYSAEEATALAVTMKPHAVISDVILPKMTGIALAEWLKQHQPACKLLLLSGHPNTFFMLEQAARRGDVFPILAKPVHPDQILKFVHASTADA